ncbi:fungal-specific transcription factor domain-containing protein [Trichoderma chlorosporum]
MSSKHDSHATSSHGVHSVVRSPALSAHVSQIECDSRDKYSFQPPITVDRPQKPRDEYRSEWKRMSCDFCRRRKVKCDKRDPCGQCSISFRDCLYTERSKRSAKRKLPSSSRLDAIEKKLKTIESNEFYPSSTTDIAEITPSTGPTTIKSPPNSIQLHPRNPIPRNPDSEEIGKCATAHHFIEQGEIEFHGTSADRTFMEELIEKLGDSSVTHQKIPIDAPVPGLFQSDARCFDEVPLPKRDQAVKLVEAALDAQILLHIVHRPSFDFSFNMIYSLEPREYSEKEKRFLSLLYAVLAFGSLFVDPYAERLEYDELMRRASRYFIKSKQLQDIASCNDLISLQAIVFKNLFLMYTTRTPFCYTYLCTSMSVALRMGLHRSLHSPQDLISREISKKIFWTLKLLCSEVATCVGLPALVNDEDSDQEPPLEVNDAYIQRGKVAMQPQNEVCYASGSICYSKLHGILHRVLKDIYPRKGRVSVEACGSMNYTVRVDTIRGIEKDLEKWANMMPLGYRLGTYYKDPAIQRAQFVLALTYSYIQLRLYRPFLHYDIEVTEQVKRGHSARLSACGSACIQACRNIIELCEDMCKWGLLTEASWPSIRILSSCLLTLLYMTVMRQDPQDEDALFKSLATGTKLLNIMERRSYQAQRSRTIIKIIISSLSIKFNHIREKLVKYELKGPDIREGDSSSVSEVSTALLGEKVFTLSSRTNSRSRAVGLGMRNGLKYDITGLSHSHSLHQELEEPDLPRTYLPLDQTRQIHMQHFTPPTSETPKAPLKSEDSPITNLTESSTASACFVVPSIPRPAPESSSVIQPTMELHQEEPNGGWMNAFDSMSYTGNVYSPMKDLIGCTSPHMDDSNEFSDIWDWF